MDNVLRQLQDAIAGLTARLGKELQGRHMSATAPSDNDLIGYNESTKKWEPKSSVPAARAYNSANISANDQTATYLTLDSERYDTDTIHSTSSNTGRLTCTTAGKYGISGSVRFDADNDGRRSVAIVLNRTTTIADHNEPAVQGAAHSLPIGTQYDLGVGDYVELQVWHNAGAALNVLAASAYSPEFMMIRLGPTGSAVGASGDSHGDLSDLTGPDDHTQYLLNTGTRAGSTGQAQDFGSNGLKADVIAESTGAAGVTVDGAELKDGGVNIAASASVAVAGTDILADSAGTMTLSNVDALDATTESAIEAAIDTLANLTSIQSLTVTLADAGANALLGWDDTASAYENLSKAEALAILNVADGADVTGSNAPQAHGPSSHTEGTGWRMVYQDTNGDDTEIGFSDDGKVLTSAGASAAPTFEAADGHAHISQGSITTVGALASGSLAAGFTDVPVAQGGTGASTAQAAIDALTAVSGATNEHVLTKDTATGNAKFKAAAGGGGGTSIEDADSDTKVQTEETGDEDKIRMDVAGTERLVLQDADPHLSLTGNFDIDGTMDFTQNDGGTESHLDITPAAVVGSTNWTGIIINPISVTFTGNNRLLYGVLGQGLTYAPSGGSGYWNIGLDFKGLGTVWNVAATYSSIRAVNVIAKAGAILGSGAITCTELTGAAVQCGTQEVAGGSASVTTARGVWVQAFSDQGGEPTTSYGIDIGQPGLAGTTTAYGLNIADLTQGTNKYPLVVVGASDDKEHYSSHQPNIQFFMSHSVGGDFMGLTTDASAGVGVMGIGNASTAPDGNNNPVGGGVLYATGGALHWLGSSGTDTVIAVA